MGLIHVSLALIVIPEFICSFYKKKSTHPGPVGANIVNHLYNCLAFSDIPRYLFP